MKYNTLYEYQNEIKRVESIINNAKSYKLKNDMTKYLKRLKKERNELDTQIAMKRFEYIYIDELEVVE